MRQLRQRPSFSVEPSPSPGILIEGGLQALDGDIALEARIPRLIDDTHPASSKNSAQSVPVLEQGALGAMVDGVSHRRTSLIEPYEKSFRNKALDMRNANTIIVRE